MVIPRSSNTSKVRGCTPLPLAISLVDGSCSRTVTRTPASASSAAVINPAGPAPATTTSVSRTANSLHLKQKYIKCKK